MVRRLYLRYRSQIWNNDTSQHWAVTFSYSCFRHFSFFLEKHRNAFFLFFFHIFFCWCYSVCRTERTSWRKPKTEDWRRSSERNRLRNEIYFNHFSIANIDSQITKVIYVFYRIFRFVRMMRAWAGSIIVSLSAAHRVKRRKNGLILMCVVCCSSLETSTPSWSFANVWT